MIIRRRGGPGFRPRWARGFPPPGTSPLSPLPSPSHRPGEGDSVGAVVLVGGIFSIGNAAKADPIGTTASAKSPSPGRWEGDGRGDRGEVSGGGHSRGYTGLELALILLVSRADGPSSTLTGPHQQGGLTTCSIGLSCVPLPSVWPPPRRSPWRRPRPTRPAAA